MGQRLGRVAEPIKRPADFRHGAHPLCPDHGRPGKGRRHDDQQGPAQADCPANLDEQGDFDQGHTDE